MPCVMQPDRMHGCWLITLPLATAQSPRTLCRLSNKNDWWAKHRIAIGDRNTVTGAEYSQMLSRSKFCAVVPGECACACACAHVLCHAAAPAPAYGTHGRLRSLHDHARSLRIQPPTNVCAGDGWSARAEDAILHGCIPLVIQDNVMVVFEQLLEWDAFALRIAEHVSGSSRLLQSKFAV